MADLGTLWFGADVDITKLKASIAQGNKDILDALKMNYDPKSYQDMINNLRSALSKEQFEIKLTANTKGLFGQGINNKQFNFGDLPQKILDQAKVVNDLISRVAKLKAEYSSLGSGYSDQQRANYIQKTLLPNALNQLAQERQVLNNLKATRTAYNQSLADSNRARREASESARQLTSDGIRLNTTLLGGVHISTQLGSALSSVFAVDAARQFLHNIIEIGGQLEKQRISMGAIIGDTARANELFDQIKSMALKSPFGVVELDQYSKQLAAYGIEQSNLLDMTKRLADISAGAGQDIGRLALALGHVKSATYLTGITLRQFSMNNIPMLKMLADYYSEVEKRAVSTAEVQKRISKRQVSYDDVVEQIKRMTDEGGQFYNMQEKISESVAAKWKNLRDSLDIMYGDMAESKLGDMLKSTAEILMGLTTSWKTLLPVLGVAATTFGVLRVSTLALNTGMATFNAHALRNTTATKELTVAQRWMNLEIQKGALNFTLFGTKVTTLTRLFASFRMAMAGVVATAKALGASLLAAVPQMALFAGISALVGLWQRNNEEMDRAKELGDQLFNRTQEGLKNLKQMMQETGMAFRDQYGNISSLFGQVPGKFEIPDFKKIDTAQAAKSIEVWTKFIKEYAATPNLMLESAYATDENGKAVHSLAEQYEILGKQAKIVAESLPLISQFGEYLSEAIEESDSGWLDDNLLTDIKNFDDAVKNVRKNAQDLYREQQKATTYALEAARGNAEFSKALEDGKIKADDYTSQLVLLVTQYNKFSEAWAKFRDGWNATTDESMSSFALFTRGETVKAEKELEREFNEVADRLKAKMASSGIDPAKLTEPERLALTRAFTDMATKAGLSVDQVRDKVWGLINEQFPDIRLDISEVETSAQVSAIEDELNKLVGEEFHIDISTATNAFDVIQKIREAYKSAKDAIENAKPILMKLGLSVSGVAAMTDAEIEAAAGGSEFVKSLLKGVQKNQKIINDALTSSSNYNFSLSDPNKGGKTFRENQEAARNKAEREAEKKAREKTKQEEARLKIEEELAKQRLELQDAIADAEVAAIENNAERERAQRKVEFEKQKRQLDRQVEEWKRKSFELAKKEHEANPKNKTISFYDTPVGKAGWQAQKLNDNQLKIYAAEWKKITAEQSRYEREYYEQKVQNMRDYFKQYGTFEEQKYAIEKEYDDKIAKERDAWLKKQLSEQKKKALDAVDIELLRTEIDWSTMFEGIGGALENEMKATLEKIEKYMQSSAFKKLDAKEKSEYVKMRNELYEKTGSGTGTFDFSIYGKIADELKAYQEAVVNHKQALIFHTDAMNKLKAIDLEVEEAKKRLKKAVTDEEKRKAEENLKAKQQEQNVQRNVVAGSGQWVQTTEAAVYDSQGKVKRYLSEAEKSLGRFSSALSQMSSGTLRGFADGIVNLTKAIGGKEGQGLSGLGKVGGIIGAILSIIDALGEAPAKFFDDLFDKISGVVKAIIEQIPQIAASVIKGAGNLIGSVFTGVAGLFTGNLDNHEEQLSIQKEANHQLEMLNERVERISDKLDKSYGAEAIKTTEELIKYIKSSQAQYNTGVQAAGDDRYGGTHSEWWHRNKNGGEGEGGYVDRIKKAYNLNFSGTSWQDLFNYLASLPENAGAQILDKLRNDSSMIDIWNELMRTNSYDDGAIAEWVKKWADSYEDIENAKKQLAERLTTTTEEDVFDDFLNSLYDFADGADDVMDNIAENWQKMVNRMVISNIMGTELQEWVANWYKQLAELQEQYAGNYDSDDYKQKLDALYSAYEEEMKRRQGQVETLTKAGIIKPIEEASNKLSDIFDNIESSFKSLISETEPDMEEWGKNVKNSIIENLIEVMVFGEEFKEWMKTLSEEFNKIWEQYENDKDENMLAAALAGLDEQIDAKGDEIAAIIKKLKETLGYSLSGEEGDNPFSGLRDSFLDTLTNMEDDAEAFRKRLTEIMVKDMIDKNVLGTAFKMDEYFDLDSGEKIEKVFENFDKYLEDWNERYKKAVESGNQDLIDALIDELVRAREITIEAAEQWRDKIKEVTKDTTFSDMSDSWVSTLMDMSKTAEDWAENVGKIMAEQIIKQMIVPTYIQPLLDELQDVFNKVMEDATSTDDNGKKVYDWESVIGSEELQAQLEIMKKKFPELQAIIKQIMDSLGLDTSNYKYSGFSNLGDSILESLKSSEGSLEDWAKSMGQQMAEDMAKAYIDATYGKDIDDLNKAWQKALQGGDTAAMKDIEDQLSALYGKMADDPELQRMIEKFRELAENPFKDMASDFASALMDMEQSAEDFANNIAKSLTQEMITKVIKDQYQGKIDALGEQWKQALEQGDSAAIERIRQQLEALYEKMGESVKPLLDAIKDIGKETDTTFTSMKDSWVSALMDMEGTAEDFAQTVGRTMAQKIITELVAPTYIEPILKRMQDAYNLAIAESGATIGSVLKKMTPFLSEIEGIYNEIQPIIQEIFGTIGIVADSVEEAAEEVEYALGDMKSNFVSALMDMTNSAEDFSKDISKIMAQTFIEKFVLGEQFDRQMEYWQAQYESIIGSGMSEDERKRQLKALRDTIVAAKEGYVNEAMAIQELFGLTTEDNQTATMNMADKITYDQADQLLGINLAQELTLEQILAELQGKDVLRVGGSGMSWQSMTGSQNDEQGKLINATLTNFAQMTQQNHDNILTQVAMANSHLQMIRDYSKKICDQVELHMESMDDKLSHLKNW